MSVKTVQEAIEDAGYENAVIEFKRSPSRGYYISWDAAAEQELFAKTEKAAMIKIAKLPNPNAVEQAKLPDVASLYVQPEVDEFGNPVHCNFGSR